MKPKGAQGRPPPTHTAGTKIISTLATPIVAGAVYGVAMLNRGDLGAALKGAAVFAGAALGGELLIDELLARVIPGDDELVAERLLKRLAEPAIVIPVAAIVNGILSRNYTTSGVLNSMKTGAVAGTLGIYGAQLVKESLWDYS